MIYKGLMLFHGHQVRAGTDRELEKPRFGLPLLAILDRCKFHTTMRRLNSSTPHFAFTPL